MIKFRFPPYGYLRQSFLFIFGAAEFRSAFDLLYLGMYHNRFSVDPAPHYYTSEAFPRLTHFARILIEFNVRNIS